MKIVGLISGGKDSIYNILKCQQYGHEIVALANLFPVDNGVSELDSFMYQTVGHELIEAYAQCTGLPLYRKRTHGKSKIQDLEYTQTEDDEVEDLMNLLAYIQSVVPGLKGVSSGAIASDYQRLRVENVCSRLGLISFSYLWQRPQDDLFQEMIDANIEAILVKVAVMGLKPQLHLGQTLQEMHPILLDLNRKFGCNVCGEGGEYETFTLDCPLFRNARIILDGWNFVLHSPDTFAPVGVLIPSDFHLESKHEGSFSSAKVLEVPESFQIRKLSAKPSKVSSKIEQKPVIQFNTTSKFINATASSKPSKEVMTAFPEEEFGQALTLIQEGIKERQVLLENSAMVSIYLSDMAHFEAMNTVYKKFFPLSRPASRICIQADYESTAFHIQVIVPVSKGLDQAEDNMRGRSEDRKVIHVQSISEWAPSCIGPYSQAVHLSQLTFFAGQIGLNPPTMKLLPEIQDQVCQVIASCEAVANVLHFDLVEEMLAMTIYVNDRLSQEAEKFVWDALHQWIYPSGGQKGWQPSITYLAVPGLPKNALVEIQPLISHHILDRENSESSNESRRNILGPQKPPNSRMERKSLQLSAIDTQSKLTHVTISWVRKDGNVQSEISVNELQQAIKDCSELLYTYFGENKMALEGPISSQMYFCRQWLNSNTNEFSNVVKHCWYPDAISLSPMSLLPVSRIGVQNSQSTIFLFELLIGA